MPAARNRNAPLPPVNRHNTDRWKEDSEASVDYYNDWFLRFAPPSFRKAREAAARKVAEAFSWTENGRRLDAETLCAHPSIMAVARQLTCPLLARDRLAGLAHVDSGFLKRCEEAGEKPLQSRDAGKLAAVLSVLSQLLDKDIMPWLADATTVPSAQQRTRAALVIADRLCGSLSAPILRNAQETRQLDAISSWLTAHGYAKVSPPSHADMEPGQFAIHLNMTGRASGDDARAVNIPVDVVILPRSAHRGDLPILLEAKSAGDFTNVNKRRKEEAQKIEQLRRQYGVGVPFVLFLCGYFDTGYLGYEAAERIDWIWEHRIDDLEKLGL